MGAWTVGYNVAGYLPEAEVLAFSDWATAYDALREEIQEYARGNDEDGDGVFSTGKSMEEQIEGIQGELEQGSAFFTAQEEKARGLVTVTLDDRNGQQIEFWLQWSEGVTPDADPDEADGPFHTGQLRAVAQTPEYAAEIVEALNEMTQRRAQG
jgi:hypothetical protein